MTRRLRACSSGVLGAIAVLAGVPLAAQGSAPPSRLMPVGDTSIFAPLTLPTANAFRTGSGAPGAAYWQNRADYATAATLDTAAMRVSGTMTLTYTNNSPDTLRYLWLQTEQNAFRTNSANSLIFPHDSRFGARGFNGGFTFFTVEQLQSTTKAQAARRSALTYRDNETMMKVDLAAPLTPGRSATNHIAYQFLVREHGADRMGRDGALYEIAQWYPRAAVYYDVRDLNIAPYPGQGEF